MPLNIPDNDKFDIFISAIDDHGLDGATLAPGQTDAVTASDPTIIITPDGGGFRPAPDGTPSIFSGVGSVANPVTNRGPITITSHISNADGSDSGIPDASDTVTVVGGLAVSQGILFGVPAAQITASGKKAAKKP